MLVVLTKDGLSLFLVRFTSFFAFFTALLAGAHFCRLSFGAKIALLLSIFEEYSLELSASAIEPTHDGADGDIKNFSSLFV